MKPSNYGKTSIITLPSGYKIKARRPSVLSLISSGGFPAALTNDMWKLIEKEKIDSKAITESPEMIKQWAGMLDAYIQYVAVDPKIVAEGETSLTEDDDKTLHGRINIQDVEDFDKQYLFLFGNDVAPSDDEVNAKRKEAEAAGLAKFPDGSARVEGGRSSEAVRTETVVAVGDVSAVPAVA